MERSMDELLEFSIINVDKPKGMTSHDVVEKVKNILGTRKAGHFGTLDPAVTGVLPIAINRACRLSNFFMKKEKEYVGHMKIHSEVSREELEIAMKKFVGRIVQLPPARSRVKREERERDVERFELLEYDNDLRVGKFVARVEAGTYIRKLVSDLGEELGCGAHMFNLRRTVAGIFNIENSFSLEEIEEAFNDYKKGDEKELRKILIFGDIVEKIIPRVSVDEDKVLGLFNGIKLKANFEWDRVSVFSGERFIGVFRREGEVYRSDFVYRTD